MDLKEALLMLLSQKDASDIKEKEENHSSVVQSKKDAFNIKEKTV